ncbi:MAG: GlsB/YeaQ/YmgE family stress response membrane protein, partial [Brevibacterium aurantiacum]|nr:GlsB/YeaQ/YmgE family stress response membrane protein [Brevibacterium aurantiacum]
VLGLIAAVIAKMILPGRQGGGWIATLVVGVLGAIVGGWIGTTLFGVSVDSFFEISSWLCAIGGSIIVLIIWGLITRRKGVADTRFT